MTPDQLAVLLDDPDPVVRERAARDGIALCRQYRAVALAALHDDLGSWEKVGDAVGLRRQDAWRLGTGRPSR